MAFWFTEKAQKHLDQIEADTIEAWGIQQAIDYTESLLESCQRLDEFPYSGTIYGRVDDVEIRRFPLKHHIILYHVVGEDIEIVSIPHGRSDPEEYFSD